MSLFVNSFVFSFAIFYVSSKILKKTIDFKDYKYWAIIIINAVIITISFIVTTHFIRVLFNYIILVILSKIYFKGEIKDIIMVSFLTFILMAIGEIICVFFLTAIFKIEVSKLSKEFLGNLWINIIISGFLITMVNIKKINTLFSTLFDNNKCILKKDYLFLVIFIVCSYSAYFYYLYLNCNILKVILLGIILILIINSLILLILKEKVYNVNLKQEFDELIANLNEYEKILEKYRIVNHENKNHFIILRDMVSKSKYSIKEYIDEIINHKKIDDEEILVKTKKFPIGGLQGLVYQKVLLMKEKGIVYNIEVSRNIDVIQFKDISFELNKDFCMIVGILIDNAIEATETLDKKEIGLYLYKEKNEIILSISNTFGEPLNLDKLDNIGYSSKGKGRGYGLYIVRKVIDRNKQITIKREIIKDVFKQKIKIKCRN